MTIWGRANSVNVQKVLWCLAELDLAYERIDAGMAFGKNNKAAYLAINPNGRVPTLVDGDYVLWESNSIMRYLCLAYGKDSPIYPQDAKARAAVDRWLDWTLSTLQPVDRPVFWALVRTPPEKRDMVAIQKDADAEAVVWRVVEAQLATRRFIEGDQFTIADIALGAFARRWFGVEGVTKPKLPNMERWFAQISEASGICEIHRAADEREARAAALAHEFDADRLAAAPDHFAGPAVARIARKGQPQFGRQRVVVVDRDLGAGRGDILHHAGRAAKPPSSVIQPGWRSDLRASRFLLKSKRHGGSFP